MNTLVDQKVEEDTMIKVPRMCTDDFPLFRSNLLQLSKIITVQLFIMVVISLRFHVRLKVRTASHRRQTTADCINVPRPRWLCVPHLYANQQGLNRLTWWICLLPQQQRPGSWSRAECSPSASYLHDQSHLKWCLLQVLREPAPELCRPDHGCKAPDSPTVGSKSLDWFKWGYTHGS